MQWKPFGYLPDCQLQVHIRPGPGYRMEGDKITTPVVAHDVCSTNGQWLMEKCGLVGSQVGQADLRHKLKCHRLIMTFLPFDNW